MISYALLALVAGLVGVTAGLGLYHYGTVQLSRIVDLVADKNALVERERAVMRRGLIEVGPVTVASIGLMHAVQRCFGQDVSQASLEATAKMSESTILAFLDEPDALPARSAGSDTDVATLLESLSKMYDGAQGKHVRSVRVREQFADQTVWEGDVEIFDVIEHPTLVRAYGWLREVAPGKERRVVISAASSLATSAGGAVRSFVDKAGQEKQDAVLRDLEEITRSMYDLGLVLQKKLPNEPEAEALYNASVKKIGEVFTQLDVVPPSD